MSIVGTLGSWNWLIAAALLLMLGEAIAPRIGRALALAAVACAILGQALPINWQTQAIIFAGLSLVLVVMAHFVFTAGSQTTGATMLNSRADQLIGQTFTIEEAILNGRGKIKAGDAVWVATGPDLASGTHVRVHAIDGTVLHVEPLSPANPVVATEDQPVRTSPRLPKAGSFS